MPAATLVITRNHPDDVQDRPVYIYLDGVKQGILRFNGTFRLDIPAGRHVVKAHNTLFGHSVDIDVEPEEEVRLTCRNGLTGGGMMMVLMLGVAYLRVRLERVASA